MKKFITWFFLICFVFFTYAEEGSDNTNITAQSEFTTVTAKKFSFSYRTDEGNLVAKVSCPTKGWVAVGFNPSKKMKGANFIIGCYDNGKQIVADHFGISAVRHKADTLLGGKNDIVESSCTEKNDITTLSFTIPLDSGDEKDCKLIPGEKTKVIFAAGKKDNFKSKHFTIAKTTVVF